MLRLMFLREALIFIILFFRFIIFVISCHNSLLKLEFTPNTFVVPVLC